MFIAFVGDVPGGELADDEWAFERDPELLAEFAVIGHRAPDAGDRRLELDRTFDTVRHGMLPCSPP
jgi:hypothetical protein